MLTDIFIDEMGAYLSTNRADEIRFDCPFCTDHRKRLYVNTVKQVCNCYNCGYTSTLVALISNLRKVSYSEAFKIYRENNGVLRIPDAVKDEVLDTLKIFNYDKYMMKSPIPLPESFTELDSSNSMLAKTVRKNLHSRLVTDEMITQHKFGYCYDGDYEGRAILTIYEQGLLQFWVARAITKNAYKKEMSPTNEEYQISKSEVIHNIDNATTLFNAMVLTEGIYDSAAFGDIGTALLGKRMSQAQLEKILKYKDQLTEGVYIGVDEDAQRYAIEMAEELCKYVPVYMLKIQDDPNSMGVRRCMEALANAEEYNFMYKVKAKLG
jgi:DNA primase